MRVISLESKALLDPSKTLCTLYLSRMRLQGYSYRTWDDPIRWAQFKQHLELVPQHALPARGDYV